MPRDTVRELAFDLHKRPPGTCAWSWVKDANDPKRVFPAVHARVDDGYTKAHPRVDIESRSAAWMPEGSKAALILMYWRFSGSPHFYEIRINHFSEIYKSPFRYWMEHQKVTLFFYENEQPPLTAWNFVIPPGAFAFVDNVESRPVWTEEDFDALSAAWQVPAREAWDKLT